MPLTWMQCSGITKKGKRCERIIGGRIIDDLFIVNTRKRRYLNGMTIWYCHQHLPKNKRIKFKYIKTETRYIVEAEKNDVRYWLAYNRSYGTQRDCYRSLEKQLMDGIVQDQQCRYCHNKRPEASELDLPPCLLISPRINKGFCTDYIKEIRDERRKKCQEK